MKRRRSNTLVVLSSAAVMAIYTAGFMKTRAAAERLEHASRQRQPVIPAPAIASATPPTLEPPPVVKPAAIETAAESPKLRSAKPAAPIKTGPTKPSTEPSAAAVTPAPVVQPEIAAPATAPAPATVPTPAPAANPGTADASPSAETLLGGIALKNGTFLGWGTSRHGDIQASVTIYSGRITAVSIAQCRTRYSCDIIAHLPGKVLKDQTPEKISNVSGATQSVDAFYWAVIDAVNKAK